MDPVRTMIEIGLVVRNDKWQMIRLKFQARIKLSKSTFRWPTTCISPFENFIESYILFAEFSHTTDICYGALKFQCKRRTVKCELLSYVGVDNVTALARRVVQLKPFTSLSVCDLPSRCSLIWRLVSMRTTFFLLKNWRRWAELKRNSSIGNCFSAMAKRRRIADDRILLYVRAVHLKSDVLWIG